MRHASLFSGIGGFDLAAQWMGWTNVFQVEWDEWCQKILTKNFPNVEKYKDIKEFDGTKYRGLVDIISGGFPCQPFSHAGKRQGEADDRYLWPEMLRVIREVKPSFVVGENVAGLVSMENGKTLEGILSDLENEGYQTESFIIPACGVGAWHRRDRIWIVCYSESIRMENRCERQRGVCKKVSGCGVSGLSGISSEDVSNSNNQGLQGRPKAGDVSRGGEKRNEQSKRCSESFRGANWAIEPDVGRVANGIPNRVDRLKGLGNAIVPQVAFELFKAIEYLHSN